MEGLLAEIRSPRVQPAGLGQSLSPLCLGSPLCGMRVSVLPEVQDQIKYEGRARPPAPKAGPGAASLTCPAFRFPSPFPSPTSHRCPCPPTSCTAGSQAPQRHLPGRGPATLTLRWGLPPTRGAGRAVLDQGWGLGLTGACCVSTDGGQGRAANRSG